MAFFSWSRWLRSLLHPQRKPIHKRRTTLPLEQLESRLAPATFIWTGNGTNQFWNNPANWSDPSHTAPTGAGNEDLVFGPGTTKLYTFNNVTNASNPGGVPIFNSITISAPGYTLDGGTLTLGGLTVQPGGATGQFNVSAAATNELVKLNINLGGSGSGQQQFTIGTPGDLTISGTITNQTSGLPGWAKQGLGRLILTGNNTWTEPFTVAQGIVNLAPASTANTPLGNPAQSTTTVQQNAQLQLTNTGTTSNHLILNGFGMVNDGALLNVAGTNTWAQNKIELDSNTYLGAAAGTVLDITSQITDNAAGFAINKEGAGQIYFDHVGGDTYRGTTTVDNGILTITDPQALGNSPTFTGKAIVNTGVGTVGTLQISNVPFPGLQFLPNPNRPGFVVANELLTINGFGFNNQGALENVAGNNTWTGGVTLGSPPPTTVTGTSITVDAFGNNLTNLLISGVISDRLQLPPPAAQAPVYFLDKDGPGRLILTAANRYTGFTRVNAGYLNVEDSQALGPVQGGTITGASWSNGVATINTSAAFGFSAGQTVTISDMQPVGYNGVYIITSTPTPTSFTYALANNPGIATNFGVATWSASLGTSVASGASLELQLQGDNLALHRPDTNGAPGAVVGDSGITVGVDNLIPVPKPDSITGSTNSMVFAESLTLDGVGAADQTGALHSISGVNVWTDGIFIPGSASIGVEPDPHQAVTSAYFAKDYSLTVQGDPGSGTDIEGGNLIVGNSLTTSNFDNGDLILPTANTYVGWTDIKTGWITAQNDQSLGQQNGADPITLQPYTTIENGAALMLKPLIPGTFISIPNNFNVTGNGVHENYALINANANAGASGGTGGAIENLDGDNVLTGIIQFNGTAGIGVEQAFPLGGPDQIPSQMTTDGPLWDSTSSTPAPTAAPFPNAAGGFNKLGSQRWIIVGPGTYSGANDIQNGAVLLQNDTGLGTVPPVVSQVQTTTTVEQGATLEFGNSVNSAFPEASGANPLQVDHSGGLAGGLAVYGEALVMKGKGDQAVGAVMITNGGAGYTAAPKVIFGAPQAANGTQATGIANILDGQVQSITITNPGSGYTSAPSITLDNTATGATTPAAAVVSNPLGDLGGVAVLTQASPVTGPFNDPIFPTDNLWAGPVILAGDSNSPNFNNIDVQANGRLVVTGVISDALPIQSATENASTVTVTVPTNVTNNFLTVGRTVVITGLIPTGYDGTFTVTNVTNNQFTYTAAVANMTAATVTQMAGASTAAQLNLVDTGEVDLYGSNTYTGNTDIQAGVVSLGNSQGLGAVGTASVQTIALANASTGNTQFNLQFGSVLTGAITYTGNPATDIQAITTALMNLPNVNDGVNVPGQPPPSDLGGQITVAAVPSAPGTFTITFGGSLLGFQQPKLIAQIVTGPGTIAVNPQGTDTYGSGGVTVESGASLQLAGSITVPGKPLLVKGPGVSATPNVATQWFPVGPAPINDGQTAGASNVTGRVTGVVANPLDPNIIYIATAGGGAWKTIDGGKSWHPIFDAIPAVQTVTVPNSVGSFALTYAGMDQFGNVFNNTTVPVVFNIANPDATAAALQAALNDPTTMPNLVGAPSTGANPDITNNGGFVTVTQQSGPGFTTFQITFQGSLAGQAVPTLTANNPAITVSVAEIGGTPGFSMFTGAIALDPNNPNIVYLGTGEALNYSDSFYGTGIYKSTDAGVTWTLLLDNVTVPGTPINPGLGKGVNKIAVDSATGDIFIADGDGGVGLNEVQQMTINAAPGQKITISLTAPDSATLQLSTYTVVFTYTGNPANDIPNLTKLLDGMSNIGGLTNGNGVTSGNVSVNFTPAQTVAGRTTLPYFTIKFGGALAQKAVPLLQVTPGFSQNAPSVTVTELVRGGPAQVLNGSTGYTAQSKPGTGDPNPFYTSVDPQGVPGAVGAAHLAGVWHYSQAAGSWFNMTDYVTGFRAGLVGQQQTIPNTAGPDDDFRITFPYFTNPYTGSFMPVANWTDVSILQLGVQNDGGEFGFAGFPTTVVYASLGTATGTPFVPNGVPPLGTGPNPDNSLQVTGDPANGVYRCENPLSNAPAWLIGDPGQPKDQVETITITNNSGPSGLFNLIFPGKSGTQNDPGPTTGNWTPNIPYLNKDQSGTIQTDLDNLPQIGGRGGNVAVALSSSNATTFVYTVTFGGTLSFSPQPIIGWHATSGLSLNISITTAGGGADTESKNEFPTITQNQPGQADGFQHIGSIKIDTWQPPGPLPPLITGVIYASVMDLNGNTLGVYKTVDGGHNWAAVTLPGNYGNGMGNLANTIAVNHNLPTPNELFVGGYVSDVRTMDNQAFLSTNGGTTWTPVSLELGIGPHTGQHASFFDTNNNLDVGNDGGIWRLVNPVPAANAATQWSDLNGDLAISQMNSVATDPTSVTSFFGGAQDNGTVQENPNAQNWVVSDSNYGGLGTPSPGPVTQVYGGIMSGGQVYIDPNNPNNIYAVQTQLGFDGANSHFLGATPNANIGPGPFPDIAGNAILRVSNNGGASWNTLWQSFSTNFPLVMDPLNPNRLLVGGFDGFTATDAFFGKGIWESLQQGAPGTWVNLENSPNFPAGIGTITGIAVAGYQGTFTADANFPDVTDLGSNTYDPNTVYATDGTNIVMTKDHAVNWVNITAGTILQGVGGIYKLVVDPTNRDTVYALRNVFGTGEIFKYVPATVNSAANWVEVGANFGLPAIPVWSLVVDPRTGTLYAGTDNGVYEMRGGLASGNNWEPMGVGMPDVQVKDLVLNQTTNTLLAATHGRGVFELFLSAQETSAVPVVAAVTALSGISEWDGQVTLGSTNVVLGAAGNPSVQNPLSTAQINFVGQISDAVVNDHPPNVPPSLVKDGLGFVIFSGPNTYGGTTDIQTGALIANNPQALGLVTSGSTVEAGAALQLESSVDAEPLILHGDGPGIGFNGHNTGALESIANNNSYFGPITLEAYHIAQANGPDLIINNVTIGVASNSTLTIVGKIGEIQDPQAKQGISLTKELSGTLILDEPHSITNSYTGTTYVNQGALAIESSSALTAFSNTIVLDGAEIQLIVPGQYYPNSNNQVDPNFGLAVTGSGTLSLSGTGINSFGALLDGTIGPDGKLQPGGSNAWSGNITLDANAGFSSITEPLGTVTLGTSDPLDILTILGSITDETATTGMSSGLGIVGKGTVILTQEDTYAGTTYVNTNSTLQIQNAQALGGAANAVGGSQVQNAILRLTTVDPSFDPVTFTANGGFYLSYNGGPPSALLASNIAAAGGFGATASLQNAVASVLGVNPANISVTRTQVLAPLTGSTAPSKTLTEFVYTVVFEGILSGMKIGQLIATAVGGAIANISTVADGGVGALVRTGGTLALNLATGSTTVSGVALQLNGTGVNDVGALENLTGDVTWEGPTDSITPNIPAITLNNDGSAPVTADAIGGADGTTLTILPDANGTPPIAGLTTAALTKVGRGTLVLPSANSFQGTTFVQNGILQVSNNNALGAPPASEIQNITLNGSTNGTYRLSLDGTNYTTPISVDFTNPATLTQLQNALNVLLPGGTLVSQAPNSNVYQVQFIGNLAGQFQPLFTVDAGNAPGTSVVPSEVIQGGRGGTVVEYNAATAEAGTLQLTNSTTFNSGEVLTLNGPGFTPTGGLALGALDSEPTGASGLANVWENVIVLAGGAATIGVGFDNGANPGLIIDQTVTETPLGSKQPLTKVGAGTLQFQGATNNTYSGLTTVANGNLFLNKPSANVDIPADLTIGVPGSVNITDAKLLQNGQLLTTATVTVNTKTGTFDVNNQTTSIGALVTQDGIARTGNTGTLTLGGLDMIGGFLFTGVAGTVNLNGPAAGTSDKLTGPGTIFGTGTFSVNGGPGTFNITQPAAPTGAVSDMDIQMPITGGAGSNGITKSGTGTLELDANNTATLTVPATVTGGLLQVDGTVGEVDLAATINSLTGVSGVGQVGLITGNASTGGLPQGAISPGDNLAANPAGFLQTNPPPANGTGTETWGPNTKLYLNLNNPNNIASPAAGSDYDQLIVNGSLFIGGTGSGPKNGGASLDGLVGPNVSVGMQFTVIRSINGGVISGRFAEPFGEDGSGNGIAFINGVKFLVLYTTNTVVLQRVLESTTLTLASSLKGNASIYGQPITFTANMLAEAGAGKLPTTDQIKFTLTQGATTLDTQTVNLDANGNAVYNPQLFKTYGAGTYTLQAAFVPDSNFTTPTPATLTWQVNQDPTTLTMKVNTTTPVIGQTVVVTVTAVPSAPGDQTTGAHNPSSPTPNVVFTVGGVAQSPTSLDASGTTTFTFVATKLTTIGISASYAGDNDYLGSNDAGTPTTITVGKDNSAIVLVPNPTSPALVGQNITFTARLSTVAPGSATPQNGDTITFTDTLANGAVIPLGTAPVLLQFDAALGANAYEAQVSNANLPIGSQQIKASFGGDLQLNSTTQSIPYVINTIPTTMTLASNGSPSILNQQVLFTATISPAGTTGPGSGAISGTVNFYDSSVVPAKLLGTANVNNQGQAVFGFSTLSIGAHTIYATYSGNTNFTASTSNSIPQLVLYGDTISVTSSLNPATYGQTEVFTAKVTSVPGTPGTAGAPQGTVDFYDGTTLLKAGVVLDATGTASFSTASLANPLSVGPHTIVVENYVSTNQYITNAQGSLVENIRSATMTTLATSVNPTGLGLPLILSATVTAVAPGFGVPTGTVTFFDAGVQIGTGSVNTTTGIATFTTSSLALGTHPLTASYGGTPTGYTPSNSNTVSELVIYADTTTLATSLNPSPVGQSVTFTATVKANANTPAGINPVGTVNFFDGATQLNANPVTLLPNGTASFSISTLSAGPHSITAVYSGNANVFISSTSAPVLQNVLNTATTQLFTSKSPTVFSEPFTLTVLVTPNLGGLPTPAGTVTVFDNTTQIGSGTLDGTGEFSFTPAPLAVGTHSNLYAVYAPFTPYTTASYYTNQSLAITQVVTIASSTTTISSSSALVGGTPTSVYSEPVTFTAQVLPVSPAQATPTGVVTFFDDTGSGPQPIGTANLDPSTGLAMFKPQTPLPVGVNNISATYAGTSTTFNGSSSGAVTQQVNPDNTTTTLAALSNTVYGQPVTFSATVKPVFPGTAAPSGTVNFFDDTGSGPQFIGTGNLNGSGVATFTPASPLTVGAHSVSAAFVATTNFNGSVSSAQSMQVSAASTTTTLSPLPTPSLFGQAVTFTATVAVVAPGTGVPSGTVNFFDNTGSGPVQIGSGGLNASGVATFMTITPLPVGSQQISASYVATTNYAGSTSSSLTQVVNPAPSTISLVSSATTAVYSQAVTFTATVTATGIGGAPTGTVTFYDGASPIGTGTLNGSGVATFTPQTPLALGPHSISALYGATGNYQGSQSNVVTEQINQAHTSTAVISSVNPSVYTQPVTFTAVITPTAPATSIPSGTIVTFRDGTSTTSFGAASVSFNPVNNDYEASYTISTLAVSSLGHNITATFPTSPQYLGSTSPIVKQIVTQAPTTTTLTSSTAFNGSVYTSVWGQQVILTAVVNAAPGIGIPLGTVAFYDGLTKIGSTSVSTVTGRATFTTSTLSINNTGHSLMAVYTPLSTINFKGSNSAAITQLVSKADVNISITDPSGTGTTIYTGSTTFTITVTAAPPGGGIINTGTVTLVNNNDPNNPVTIGNAIYIGNSKWTITAPAPTPPSPPNPPNPKALQFGPNALTVIYSGNNFFNGGTGDTVESAFYATKTTLSVSPVNSFLGDTVTLTATVAPGVGVPNTPNNPAPLPTGVDVTFYNGGLGNPIGTATLVDGIAQLQTSSLNLGSNALTVVFPGDNSFYAASTSPVVIAKVFAQPASLKVTYTKPATVSYAFSITAVLLDINNNPIAGAPGVCTVTAVGTSPPGGFNSVSVAYVNGKFSFTNLHVTTAGHYQLLVSYGNLQPFLVEFTTTGRLSG